MNCKTSIIAISAALAVCCAFAQRPARRQGGGDHPSRGQRSEGGYNRHSAATGTSKGTIVDDEARRLIAAYRRDPSESNRATLEKLIRSNCDKEIARRKAELEDLRKGTADESKIKEAEEEVKRLTASRDIRVERIMARITEEKSDPEANGKSGDLPNGRHMRSGGNGGRHRPQGGQRTRSGGNGGGRFRHRTPNSHDGK